MLARSPQHRAEEGLGPMRPIGDDIPSLAVTEDPKTRQRAVKLTLHDAVVRALANNTDIAVVSYTPQIAREQVVQAAAAFDYTVFGSMGYDKTNTAQNRRRALGLTKNREIEFGVRQDTILGGSWSLTNTMVRSWDDHAAAAVGRWYEDSLALEVTQPLLRGAWPEVNLAQVRIARLNHKITMSQFRQQIEATVTEVITSYYQLIQARHNVEIAQRLLDRTNETYRQVEARRELDATKVQIKQAESAVKFRLAVLLQTIKIRGDTQENLARLLADSQINVLEKVELIPTTEMGNVKVEFDATDQLLTALRLNPDLEQARLAIQASEINVKVAKNEILPQLNITAGASLDGGSNNNRKTVWNDVVSGNFVSYDAALTFEYPLGNRLRRAQLAEAKLTRLQTITQMQNTADVIAQQIKEQIRQIATSFEEYKVQGEALAASKDQLDGLEQLQRIRGRLTPEFLNLKLQTQRDVASAEQAQLAALVTYNVAMLDLAQTTGAVLEMNQVRLAMPVILQMPDVSDAAEEARPAATTRPGPAPVKTQPPTTKPAAKPDVTKPLVVKRPEKPTPLWELYETNPSWELYETNPH